MGSAGTVLVTGGSSGIGYELAKRFARAGHDLVLVARNQKGLEECGAELTASTTAHVTLIAKDLAKPGTAQEIFDELQRASIEIAVLVNCAGVGRGGAYVETDSAGDVEMLRVNVVALTELTKLAAQAMVHRGRGSILNVASTAAFQPGPRMAVYAATKAYVLSLSEALASELADSGVTISTLCPGPTRTAFARRATMESARVFRAGVMDATVVAEAGYRGLMKGQIRIIPGVRYKMWALSVRFAPRALVTAVVGWLNAAPRRA